MSSTLATYLRDIAQTAAADRRTKNASSAPASSARRDEAALNRLVESNLRFVVSCAKRYRRARRVVPRSDP